MSLADHYSPFMHPDMMIYLGESVPNITVLLSHLDEPCLLAGCKRKFDVNKYIAKVDSAIRELKAGKGTGPQNNSMLNYLQPKAGRKK